MYFLEMFLHYTEHQMNIGVKIKQAIEQAGYSNRDAARQMGISENALYKIFNKEDVNTKLLVDISTQFGLPITYFFDEEVKTGHQVRVDGDQNTTVTGNGKFFSGRKVPKGHANGGGEGSAINEKVKMLEQLLAEKDRVIEEKEKLIEEKEKLIEEKERLIRILMEKR